MRDGKSITSNWSISGFSAVAPLFIVLLLLSADARAGQTTTWSGANTAAWNNAGNWSAGIPGTNNGGPITIVIFPATGAANKSNNNDITGLSLDQIQFTGAGGTYVITGNGITLANNQKGIYADNSAGTNDLGIPITLGGNQNLVVASSGAGNTTLIISGNIITGGNALNLAAGSNGTSGIVSFSSTSVISGTGGIGFNPGGGGITAFAGTVSISGNNSFTGAITVPTNVTLIIASNNALGGTGGTTTISTGAVLQVQGNITSPEPLTISGTGIGATGAILNNSGSNTLSGTIALGAATTIGAASGSTLTLSNTISGAQNLTLSGAGTIVLSGTNSYTGTTTINSTTTVYVDGTSSTTSGTTVNGILGGIGTVSAVTCNSGTITPGNLTTATSILNTGAVTFTGASKYTLQLNGSTAGTGYDQIKSTGAVALGSNITTLDATIGAGFYPTDLTTFDIVSAGAAVTGTFKLSNGTPLTDGTIFLIDNQYYQINYNLGGNNVRLTRRVRTFTWSGGGGDNKWSTGLNWDLGVAPGIQDKLVFGTTTPPAAQITTNTNDFLGVRAMFDSITFATSGYILNGNSVILTGGVLAVANNVASGTNTINNNIVFSTNAPTISCVAGGTLTMSGTVDNGGFLLTANSAGSTTITGAISNTGGLTSSGAGTLTLSGNSSYSGQTIVTAGTLSFNTITTVGGGNSALGAPTTAANGTIKVGNAATGATLIYTGTGSTTDRVIDLAGTTGGATLDVSGTGNLQFNSAFTATGAGSKTLTLQGSTSGTGTISAAIVDNGAGNVTSLTKSGSGTWTLTGNSSFTGQTTINNGTLSISSIANGGSPSALGSTAAATPILIGSGSAATLSYTGGAGTSNRQISINGTGGGTIQKTAAGTLALSGAINGAGFGITFDPSISTANVDVSSIISGVGTTVTKISSGVLILSGAASNTYSGGTTVKDGEVDLNKTAGIDAIPGTGAFSIGDAVGAANSAIVKLLASNQINDSAAVTINGADGYLNMNSFSETIGSLAGSGSVDNTVAGTPALIVGSNNTDTTFSGVIKNTLGTLSLTKIGTGTLTLSGANTYSGATNIQNGTIKLATGNDRLPTGTTLTIGQAATANVASLDLGGFNQQVSGIDAVGTTLTNDTVTTTAAGTIVLTVNNNAANFTFGGLIQNSVSLTKSGSQTLTLTGSNTYTGVTTINGGILSVSTLANGGLPSNIGQSTNAATNLVLNGGTLQYTGAATSTDRLFSLGTLGGTIDASGTGAVNFTNTGSIGLNTQAGARTLTLTGTNAGSNILSAVIVNDGANPTTLVKSGTGLWILGADNTYTGSTTINAGTLQVGNAGATGTLGTGNITDNGSLIFNRTVDYTVSANISGTGLLTQNGSNILTLSGANTYQGQTNINTGTVAISAGNNIGDAASIANTISINGGTLESTANSFSLGANRVITLNGAGTVKVDAGTLTIDGNVSNGANLLTVTGAGNTTISGIVGNGTGGVTKTDTGTLTLSNAANTYTGATTINGGVLSVSTLANGGTASGIGSSGSGAGNLVLGGGTLQYTGGTVSINRAFTLTNATTGTFDIQAAGTNLTISGSSAASSGSLTKIGAGTLTLSGANTYTGVTTINAGTLNAGSVETAGTSGPFGALDANAANTIVFGGGTLQYSAANQFDYSGRFSTANNQAISIDTNGQSVTFATSLVSNGGTLTKLGVGTLTLAADNTYTGVTTISAGTLQSGNGGATGTLGTGNITDNAALVFNRTANYSVSAVISGTGTIAQNGSNVLTLTGTNTYSGTTSINAGTLNANTTDAIGNGTATNTLIFNGGTLQAGGAINSPNTRSVTMTSTGLIDTNGSSISIAGVIGGAGGLTKNGAGTLTLSNSANTFAGAVTLNAGTTSVVKLADSGSTSSLGTGNGITLGSTSAATLSYSGGTDSTNRPITLGGSAIIQATAIGTLTLTGGITNGVNTVTFDANTGNITESGVIGNGTGGVTKTGTGTLTLSNAANTYTGATTINAGVLSTATLANGGVASGIGASGNGAANLVLGGGTLQYTGNTVSTDRNFTLTGGTISSIDVSVAANTLTISGAADPTNGALTKIGSGTLLLTGTNLYTGATSVNAGTLLVDGSLDAGSAVTVGSGATLGGTGTINGSVTVSAGGTLSPGDPDTNPGLLSTGPLSASGAATLKIQINGVTAGTNYDQLAVTGAANLNNFTLQATLGSGFSPSTSTSFTIVTSTGALSGNFSGLANGGTKVIDGRNFLATYNANSFVLTHTSQIFTWTGAVDNLWATLTAPSNWDVGYPPGNGDQLIFPNGAANKNNSNNLASSSFTSITLTGAGYTLNGNAITLTGGATALTYNTTAGANTINTNLTFSTNAPTITCSVSTLTIAGTIDNGAFLLTTAGNGDLSISGVISNTGGLTKNGTGTLTLSNAGNTYTGQTTINAGTLSVTKMAAGGSNSSLGATAAATPILLGSASAATLSYTGGSDSSDRIITINGAGGGTIQSTIAGTLTLSGGVSAGGNALTFDTNVGDITESGVISGSGTVAKTGTGRLTFSGANSYSGATDVNAGILNIQNASALGGTGTGTTVASGAALQIQGGITVDAEPLSLSGTGFTGAPSGALQNVSGNNTYQGAITLSAASTITSTANLLTLSGGITNGANALTFDANSGNILESGIIGNGSGSLTKTGTGTLILSNDNTYSGNTTINAGILSVVSLADGGTASGIGLSTNAAANLILGGGTLQYTGATKAINRAFTITNATTGTFDVQNAATNLTISGASASTTGALSKVGAGTLTLSGGNTYTGVTNINGGTLNAGVAESAGTSGPFGKQASNAADTIVFGGGTLQYSAVNAFDYSGRFSTAANQPISIDTNGRDVIFATALTSAGGTLTKLGTGVLSLTGNNSYSGTTTVSAGTLQVGNNTATGTLGSGNVTDNASLVFNRTGALAVANTISGTGSVTQSGSGTTTVTGTNTYTGSTTISAGILNVNSSAALGDDTQASNTLIFNGGTLQAGGGIASPATRGVTMTSTGIIDTNGNNASIAGLIGGAGGLTKNGTGTLTLSNNANTFSGAVTLNAGTTSVAKLADSGTNSGLGSGNGITLGSASAATLSYTGGNDSTNRPITLGGSSTIQSTAAGTLTLTGGIANGGNTVTFDANTGNISESGVIGNGAGGVTKTGTGTLTLSNAANTYTGATTINAGVLSVSTLANGGSASGIGASSNAAGNLVLGGGTLQYTGGTTSTDRNFTLTGGTSSSIDVSVVATNLTISGGGAATNGGLTKIGAGTLILSGTNLYTGATTVTVGTLGGTGTGSIAGNLVASGAGTVAPGLASAVGTFTSSSGNADFSGGGTLLLQLSSLASYDKVVLSSGALTAGGGTLTLDLNGLTTPGVFNGVVTYTGGVPTGTFAVSLINNPSGYSASVSYTATQINITINGATKLAITAITPASPVAGVNFTVTVYAYDTANNPANVVANTDVSLSVFTGTGALAGTFIGTITAGTDNVVIGPMTYSIGENGVVLRATRTAGDNLASGDSAAFNVQPQMISIAWDVTAKDSNGVAIANTANPAQWNITGVPLGSVHRTDTGAAGSDTLYPLVLAIKNQSNLTVTLNASTTGTTVPAGWTLGAAATDKFQLYASNNGLAAAPNYVLLSAPVQVGAANIAINAVRRLDLKFVAPPTTTNVSSKQITVTITATAP